MTMRSVRSTTEYLQWLIFERDSIENGCAALALSFPRCITNAAASWLIPVSRPSAAYPVVR
jgi:hypothetical protein